MVVLLVALYLLAGVGPAAGDITSGNTQAYWQQAQPLAVVDAVQRGTNATLIVQNQGRMEIWLTNISLGNGTGSGAVSVIPSGRRATATVVGLPNCTSDRIGRTASYALNFTYSTDTAVGVRQVGAVPLGVLCIA